MNKNIRIVFLVSFISLFIVNCEKDDICADGTPTTPRLVIDFFNSENPSVPRNVIQLQVKSPDVEQAMLFNAVSQIAIPLKTFEDETVYEFTINSDDSEANTDIIHVNYTRSEIYISRACGFKTYFNLLPVNGFIFEPDSDNWIQSISIQRTLIDSEEDVHIKIFY